MPSNQQFEKFCEKANLLCKEAEIEGGAAGSALAISIERFLSVYYPLVGLQSNFLIEVSRILKILNLKHSVLSLFRDIHKTSKTESNIHFVEYLSKIIFKHKLVIDEFKNLENQNITVKQTRRIIAEVSAIANARTNNVAENGKKSTDRRHTISNNSYNNKEYMDYVSQMPFKQKPVITVPITN